MICIKVYLAELSFSYETHYGHCLLIPLQGIVPLTREHLGFPTKIPDITTFFALFYWLDIRLIVLAKIRDITMFFALFYWRDITVIILSKIPAITTFFALFYWQDITQNILSKTPDITTFFAFHFR